MTLRMIVKPAAEPVDMPYFLRHTKVEAGVEDADCMSKLTAAIRAIEQKTGRDRLLESTWAYSLACFPRESYLELPLPQVSSIVSITSMDSTGATNIMPSTDYRLLGGYTPVAPELDSTGINDQVTFCARVILRYWKSWPFATLETGEPVVVTFIAGWKNPENVPEDLKAAICLRGAHLYRNRESVTVGRDTTLSSELALGEKDLTDPYRSAAAARCF